MMLHGHKNRTLLVLFVLAALLLTACGAGQTTAPEITKEPAVTEEPAITEEPAAPLPEGTVEVGTVDELLAALAPNTTILLREGEYDLSTASDYGTEDLDGYYRWELVYGGCQLDLTRLSGLTLKGEGQVSILARTRYAQVLCFVDCWDLSLENLTLGHTTEPGICSAGVLDFESCDDVSVDGCRLYGCGTLGVYAYNCQNLYLRGSQIDNCSYGAVKASECRDLRLEDCRICDCGLSQAGAGEDLFCADHCTGFALVNCEITGNRVQRLLQNIWSGQLSLLGCRVEQNRFLSAMFLFEGRSATVDKCSFRRRSGESYYPSARGPFAKTPEGEDLISFDLDHMELARASYNGPVAPEEIPVVWTEKEDGSRETRVSTVDQLLAAIGPNTTILLDAGVYDLTSAVDYGGAGSRWYTWESSFDGYSLQIRGVQGLQIRGAGKGETVLVTVPRYAAVFGFSDCEQLCLSGFTAGHTPAPGYCTGDVLDFQNCSEVTVEDCGLYGCGVEGIWAMDCSAFTVRGSEIYECSYGAASFNFCRDVRFEGCSIHDCDDGNNYIYVNACEVLWEDSSLAEGVHEFDGENYLGMVQGY